MNPYHWFIQAKNFLYDNQYLKTFQASVPVISVGNINTGGSGKTPFIQFLVKHMTSKYPQKKVVIISRSYKASLQSPAEVIFKDQWKPELYGDEPCLLKSATGVDVWAGPHKVETLKQALAAKNYDVAIIDDGFSHLRIKRQLEIVLFDASREHSHYRMIPLGFMREPWSALKRANLVILTKKENQPEGKLQKYRKQISQYQPNILDSLFVMDFSSLSEKTKNVYLFSGIGNPKVFENEFKNQGYSILKNRCYADHYGYPANEEEIIWREVQELRKKHDFEVVTTPKDFIKIKKNELRKIIKVVDVRVSMSAQGEKALDEKISQLF